MAAGRLTPPRRTADVLLAAIVTGLWAATILPLFDFALSDTRLLEAFSIDELIQVNMLHHAASAHTFALTFGPYGHLVFNLILIVVRLLPGAVTDARILYVGRSINLVFGVGTALLIFAWTRRTYGRAAAWIALSLLVVNGTLYMGIAQMQPDIVQLFLLMASLALTVRLANRPDARWLVLASATAGLAFACKYSGLFVLPIVAIAVARRPVPVSRPGATVAALRAAVLAGGALLVVLGFFFNAAWIAAHLTEDGRIDSPIAGQVLSLLTALTRGAGGLAIVMSAAPWLWHWLRRSPHGLAVAWSWSLALVTFVAAFVIASPYSLRKAAFIKGLLGEAGYAPAVSLASQLGALAGFAQVIGWASAIAALVTIAVLLWRTRPLCALDAVDAVLISWTVIYTIVLLLPAHEIYVDYALPLVPVAAMLAGRGAGALLTTLSGPASVRRTLMAAAVVLVVVVSEVPMAGELLKARAKQRGRLTDSMQAYVATWLQCRAPASTRIAYDYFVYVPSTFPNAFVTWGGTREWLAATNPDLVAIQVDTTSYAVETPEHREYYDCLAAGTCGYERALSREDLVVYVRRGRRADVLNEDPAQLRARGCL